jgi:hypothetical protein
MRGTDDTDGDDTEDGGDGATTDGRWPSVASRRAFLAGVGVGAGGVGLATNRDRLAGLVGGEAGTATHRADGHGAGGHGSDADAVRALVPDDAVTHRATGGDWTAAASWDGDRPGDEARVLIPAETTVTLDDTVDAAVHTVRVDGTLRVDPAATTRLAVDTLVVTDGGRLELGTPDDPVGPDGSATVEFRDRGAIDEEWDPERISRGLIALGGATVRLAGAETTAFAETAVAPESGDQTLELASAPTGWQAGDRLVLAGSHPDRNEDEELTVTGVSGTTVRLDRPLEHDHVPPREAFSAYVLNRDRHVTLRSASDRTKRRGHVMFMTDDVVLRHAAFAELGRTDKSRPFTDPVNGVPPEDVPPNPQARYACHFHRTGTGVEAEPRQVVGCHVDGSPGWGYVNHGSYVRFAHNTAYRVFGAAFVAETGAEAGTFHHNFALRSHGSGNVPDGRQFKEDRAGAIDDFGHGGYGFWFQGPDLTVTDNVAAGHRHHGFVYWNRAKPDREVPADALRSLTGEVPNLPVDRLDGQPDLARSGRVEDGMVPSSFVRLREFSGNTVFASGGGLDVSRHQFGYAHDRVDAYSVIEDFTAFDVGAHHSQWDHRRPPNDRGAQGGTNGISVRYSANVVVRNPTLVAGRGDHRGVGINRNHAPSNVHVENPDVEGWFVGIRAPPRGTAPVEGGRLDNHVDVQVIGGTTDRRWSPKQQVAVDDVYFGDGGRSDLFLSTALNDDLYGLFTPEGHVRLDGTDLAFAKQAPDVVPYPSKQDLPETGDDPLADLADVAPERLVGKSNADLTEQYGLAVEGRVGPAVDAERPAGVSVGRVTDGSLAAPDGAGPIEYVSSAVGSLFEVGRLGQGERLTVYGDATVQTVPGLYAGLPYVRLEGEDGDVERQSWLLVGLSAASDVFVASETEETPGWLSAWDDTGDTLGTSVGTKRVFRRSLDAGRHWLSGVPASDDVPTVFVREK